MSLRRQRVAAHEPVGVLDAADLTALTPLLGQTLRPAGQWRFRRAARPHAARGRSSTRRPPNQFRVELGGAERRVGDSPGPEAAEAGLCPDAEAPDDVPSGALQLAVAVGFEPTVEFPPHTLSRRAP